MKPCHLLFCTVLATSVSSTALAAEAGADGKQETAQTSLPAAAPKGKAFSTGVAKGRDLLDTAISASVIDEADLAKLSVSSVSGILQNIPGIRSETSDVDGYAAITVRGLPLAADGSKFLQLQEDGLPVLEFGDVQFGSADRFLRADLTLSQVQSIRGGSSSTFASNAPGGVVNLISKTGETEGGNFQISSGLGYDLKRVDFDYGSPLGENWRFHVGGFYRDGEGPRDLGYTAFGGGQVKLNVTRKFNNGYIRFYGKYLDDRQPNYGGYPVLVAGSNSSPTFADIPGNNVRSDAFGSSLTTQYLGLDRQNNRTTYDSEIGMRALVKAVGLEMQIEVANWTLTNRFRFSDISGTFNQSDSSLAAPAPLVAMILGGPGASLSYANGPLTGQAIGGGNPINGNGLASLNILLNMQQDSLDNITDDLRASRVFSVGGGKLTATLGVYNSSQDIDATWKFTNTITDVVGNGQAALLNLNSANGALLTQNGTYSYGFGIGLPRSYGHYHFDANYRIVAPYGSLNFQTGKLSVGASVRYDSGRVKGNVYSASFDPGRISDAPVDLNGDGVITGPEAAVPLLPLDRPTKVNYGYNYLSYSAGVNYRLGEPLSVFARYSRGGRASAERVLTATSLNGNTGKLLNPALAYGLVKQAEAGLKFRKEGVGVYLTGFWAATDERNTQIGANAAGQVIVIDVQREYSAKGFELESELRSGPFALTLGATWTRAKIVSDISDPTLNGNRPRHIPTLSFQARPQVELDRVTFGAVLNGTSSSFAQDVNLLKQPGYVLVSPFLQLRPIERLQIGLNAFNVFNKLAIVSLGSAAIPASGIVNAQIMNGRTVTASARISF